jgi:hypothetical protein
MPAQHKVVEAQPEKKNGRKRLPRRKRGEDRSLTPYPALHYPPPSGLAILQQHLGNRALQRALAQGLLSKQAVMRQRTAGAEAVEETKTLSGASWVEEFPTSTEVSDLDSSFSGKVQKSITALESAGAAVEITATKRPAERAYLMHWAWMIAKKGYNPRRVPALEGVEINWWHGDLGTSRNAAQEMVDRYGINKLKVAPALNSHHITGKAIDMKISWGGDLTILNARGMEVLITTSPRDHTNRQLIVVARTYQVIHYIDVAKDRVHWSIDGH